MKRIIHAVLTISLILAGATPSESVSPEARPPFPDHLLLEGTSDHWRAESYFSYFDSPPPAGYHYETGYEFSQNLTYIGPPILLKWYRLEPLFPASVDFVRGSCTMDSGPMGPDGGGWRIRPGEQLRHGRCRTGPRAKDVTHGLLLVSWEDERGIRSEPVPFTKTWSPLLHADLDHDGRPETVLGVPTNRESEYRRIVVRKGPGDILLDFAQPGRFSDVRLALAGAPHPILLTVAPISATDHRVDAFMYRPSAKRLERIQWNGQDYILAQKVEVDPHVESGAIMIHFKPGAQPVPYWFVQGRLEPRQ